MGLLNPVGAAMSDAGRRASDLARAPQMTRLRERGGNLVVDRARTMKQKLTSRAQRGNRSVESTGAGPVPAARRRRHTPTWRPRFLWSRAAHFPPPQDNAPPTAPGGTTVMEDSKAAVLGMPATLGPETPQSPPGPA